MKNNLLSMLVFFSLFLFSAAFSNSATVVARKVDPRLLEGIIAVQNNQSPIQSKVFLKSSSGVTYFSVIVYARSLEEVKTLNITPRSFNGRLFTASVTYEQLVALSNLNSVSYIESPRMRYPKLDKSIVEMKVDKLHSGQVNSTAYTGEGVIVGVIDTGIDWKHLDFRSDTDTTKSRILFLLDQTTGLEFTQAQINNELDGTPANVVTEEDLVGHGTHVASIAAGDGSASSGLYQGVAPKADLIIVKAGDDGFPTDNIINAISYIRQKAVELNKPFVINMSLGSHDGSHDGTAAEEEAVDAELVDAVGRQIVIAAGNEGSDAIHTDGTVSQSGSKDFQFTIPAYTPTANGGNDYVVLTMWYKAGDNLSVSVKSPDNTTVAAASGSQSLQSANQGKIEIYNAVSGVNPKNGAKECSIQIFDETAAKAPAAGVWTVTVSGTSVSEGGTFDAWIGGSSMNAEISSGATFTKLVGMPGTVESGITVGAYVTKWSWTSLAGSVGYVGTDRTNNFSTFSSMGPTRDGRQKPDVSAPGQAIAAAMSGSTNPSPSTQLQVSPAGKYVIEQGTSMATPHVAGLVALMLQAKPNLTAVQIRSAINATARKDAFTGPGASSQWGNGKVDAVLAVQNILSVTREAGKIPVKFSLEQNYPNPFNPSTKIHFSIPYSSYTTLTIYSALGEKIATVVQDQLEAGSYSAGFNAEGLASGVYFYTLTTSAASISKKMLLLR